MSCTARPRPTMRLLLISLLALACSQVAAFYLVPPAPRPLKASSLAAVLRLPQLPPKGAMLLWTLPTIFRRFRPGFRPNTKASIRSSGSKRGLLAAAASAFSERGMREVTEGVEQEAIAAQPDLIPVLIRYTGGSGARALYNGCVKCIREGFPNVSIRKMILANSNSISKKQAIFEVLVGDQVISSKQREANGIYLPMQDLQQAIERASQSRKDQQLWNKFLDDEGQLRTE